MNNIQTGIKILMLPLFLSSCALLLITEPDEHAKRAAANGGVLDMPCGSCGKEEPDGIARSSIDVSKSRYSLKDPGSYYQGENFRGSYFSVGHKNRQSNANKVKLYHKQLASGSDAERTRAASSLGEIGVESRIAVPDLERLCLRDKSKWVRRASVKALEKINGTGSRNVISQAARYDKDPYVKGSANSALMRLSKVK